MAEDSHIHSLAVDLHKAEAHANVFGLRMVEAVAHTVVAHMTAFALHVIQVAPQMVRAEVEMVEDPLLLWYLHETLILSQNGLSCIRRKEA